MNRHQLVQRLIGSFDDLHGELIEVDTHSWGNSQWTKAILTNLCELGQSLKFSTWASRVPSDLRDGGEWLYDTTWLGRDGSSWSVPMIAECEWLGMDEVVSDFQKLIIARATVKVMICDGALNNGGLPFVANKLCDAVGEFDLSEFKGGRGDTYLIVAYVPNGNSWRFEYATIVAQGRGHIPSLRLHQ